jgi:PAS domain S-box-containing protein
VVRLNDDVRILVVDDNLDILSIVSRLLREAGYEVTEAATGQQCLQLAQEEKPDIILLDVNLPDVDGIEVCRRIKADPPLSKILIAHLSATNTSSESQVAGLEAGADAYIVHPVSHRELLARVRALARLKRAEDALRRQRDELANRRALLETALQLGKAVTQVTDQRSCLRRVYESVQNGLSFDRVGIFIYDRDQDVFHGTLGTDCVGKLVESFTTVGGIHAGTFRDVLSQPAGFVFIPDFAAQHGEYVTEDMEGVKENAAVALWAGDSPVGILCVDNLLTQRPMSEEQLEALRLFAGYAGAAIENAHLLAKTQAAEERYRSIFENAAEGIFRTTPDGRFQLTNPALARMLGYDSPEELIAQFTDIGQQLYVHPEQRLRIKQLLEEHGSVQDFEAQFYCKDGSVMWATVNARIVRDESGATLYYEGTNADITQRKRAEIRSEAFSELGRQLSTAATPQEAAYVIAEVAGELLGWDACFLDLYAPEREEVYSVLQMDTVNGQRIATEPVLVGSPPGPLSRRAIEDGAQLFLREHPQTDIGDSVPFGDVERPSLSLMFVPIRNGNQVTGVLSIQSYTPQAYNADDLNTLQALADHCAGALDRLATERALRQTAEARREADRRLREMLETAQLIALGLDAEGNVTFCNDYLLNLVGWQREELLGRNWCETCLPADVRAVTQQEFLKCVREGAIPPRYENEILTRAGERRLISWTNTAQRDLQGKVIGASSLGEDVTERKRAEQLQAVVYRIANVAHQNVNMDYLYRFIHQELSGILDAQNFYIALYDAEQDLLLFPYYADETRTDPQQVNGHSRKSGKGLTEYVLRTGRALFAYAKDIQELAEKGEIKLIGNLSRVWLGAPLKSGDRIIGVVAVQSYTNAAAYTPKDLELLEFISSQIGGAIERKWAEESLAKERNLLRTLMDNLPDYVFVKDTESRFLTTNAAHLHTLGVESVSEVVGKTDFDFFPQELAEQYYADEQMVIQSGSPLLNRVELVVDKAGRGRWFLTTKVPLRDHTGAITGLVGISRDITDRKRAEEVLQETNRRLEHALAELQRTQQHVIQQERLRAIGTMASGIAHDFNNALSPILGYSELLLAHPDDLSDRERVKRYLERMNVAAQDAAHVVSRLREFYRHRDKSEAFLPIHVNQIAEQALSLTQPKWKNQALAKGITIQAQTDLRPVPTIMGNESDLREMMTNLIFNAVDAMPTGGVITIRTYQYSGIRVFGCSGNDNPPEHPNTSTHVVLEVSDTGVGMTEEVRQRCLEPFFTTKGERGTGMGLAMVYGIVQRHEGTMEIESALGQGTTITIRLPMQRERQVERGKGKTERQLHPLNVLFIEDEPLVCDIVTEYLIEDGHTFEVASNGLEGLERFEMNKFNLIITDRAMPEMSGDHVATAIKQMDPHVPIIMLTGFGDLMNSAGERPLGVDLIVSKPVTIAKLRQAILQVTPREKLGKT